jgi:hypothetical protein
MARVTTLQQQRQVKSKATLFLYASYVGAKRLRWWRPTFSCSVEAARRFGQMLNSCSPRNISHSWYVHLWAQSFISYVHFWVHILNSVLFWALTLEQRRMHRLARTIQYNVYMVLLAGKSPNIRSYTWSYTVCIYCSTNPKNVTIKVHGTLPSKGCVTCMARNHMDMDAPARECKMCCQIVLYTADKRLLKIRIRQRNLFACWLAQQLAVRQKNTG